MFSRPLIDTLLVVDQGLVVVDAPVVRIVA